MIKTLNLLLFTTATFFCFASQDKIPSTQISNVSTFTAREDKATISGVFTNAENSTLYLSVFINNNQVKIDSTVIKKNGKFKLSTKVNLPEFYTLSFTPQEYLLIILDSTNKGQTVNISGDKNDLFGTYTVSNSFHSGLIQNFVHHLNDYQKLKKDLTMRLYQKNLSSELRHQYQSKIDSLEENFIMVRDTFVDKHYNSLAVITAMSYLNPQTDLDKFKKIEQGLSTTVPNSEYHIAVLTQIKQIETQLRLQEEQAKEEEERQKSSAIGAVAPNLQFANPNGEIISVASLKGNYVLLDFWASWCRPCRMENPNVVKAYHKFKDKGFTVMSISLDKAKESWIQAIEQDDLAWPNHVSDLKGWQSEAVKEYNFRGIPFTVLLDRDGKIIAKNLRGDALEHKLEELLGK